MDRGAEGDRIAPETDAFTVVHDFMEKLGDRMPTADEIAGVRPALEALHEKLMRLRAMSPLFRRVDFSERIWKMMELVGKKPQPAPRSALGRAASFL